MFVPGAGDPAPPTLPGQVCRVRADFVPKPGQRGASLEQAPHEVERGNGRAGADPFPLARKLEPQRPLALGPGGVEEDEADGLLRACHHPVPRHRSPTRRRRPRAVRARRPPSRRPPRPRRRRGPRACRPGRRAARSLTSLSYATIPPRKTSLAPATDVSRPATRPPVHDSAVPSVKPRARHSASTSSCTDRSSRPKRYSASGSTNASSSASARSSAPGSTIRSTWISKSRAQIVASTPSPSPPASASALAIADSLAP